MASKHGAALSYFQLESKSRTFKSTPKRNNMHMLALAKHINCDEGWQPLALPLRWSGEGSPTRT